MTAHEVLVNSKPHRVEVLERNGNNFLVRINEKTVKVKLPNSFQGKATIEIDGQLLQAEVKRVQGNVVQVKIGGKLFEVQYPPKIFREPPVRLEPMATVTRRPATSLTVEKDAVTAPIAGRIVLLKANVGQTVEKGECVCILEAMKMENEVAAPKAGVVREIRVSEGAVVNKGDVLAVIA